MRSVFFSVAIFLCGVSPALASAVTFHTNSDAFPVFPVDDIVDETQIYYGELDRSPHTYEFIVTESFTFTASVFAPVVTEEQTNISLILVRVREQGGVAEVERASAHSATWDKARDKLAAVTYVEGPTISEPLAPGTYRFEISTPENIGQYKLVLGDPEEASEYQNRLQIAQRIRDFHDLSSTGLVVSPLIYQPVGIIVFCGLFFITWRRRRRLTRRVDVEG